MATPKNNVNCCYMQNDPHKCKIKLQKLHFDILYRFRVITESLPGGRGQNVKLELMTDVDMF